MNTHSIKKLLNNMFIAGFQGENPSREIKKAVESGLGGVIFFSENIIDREKFKENVKELKTLSPDRLITSIDQEGGLVERTINLKDKIDYLTPMGLAQSRDASLIKEHYDILCKELLSFGINMNFAPDLDVNTVETNSIIGLRSFSNDPDEVEEFSSVAIRSFKENGILSVGKHFPGHGHCSLDSHKGMVEIDLDFEELDNIHIKPFKRAVNEGADAIMAAHAIYSAFDKELPASLSFRVINYLREKVGFEGLIISDDMVMGAISKYYTPYDACIKAIKAGVNMLIFRNFTHETEELIEKLAAYAFEDEDFLQKILFSNEKVNECKSKIVEKDVDFDVKSAQSHLLRISKKTIKILKKEKQLLKEDPVLILKPKRSEIHHYKTDTFLLSDILGLKNAFEIEFSLNPCDEEIEKLKNLSKNYDHIIFVSYNAILHEQCQKLLKEISPSFAIGAGMPYDQALFGDAEFYADLCGYKKYGFINLKDELII